MKNMIKKFVVTFLIIVSIFILCTLSAFIYREKRNALAKELINETIKELSDFESTKGYYPDSLNDLQVYEKLNEKILWVLPQSEIFYRYDNSNKSYFVSYHIYPFGPFSGYDKKKDEWYHEE